ncbi:hypothetical protein P20495_2664 [Pseudoalteromonas sp. BSi20495]|nr:hypothetical protein P20495_2664 [Pseudoalteromonas sp. BSi20495]
MKGQRRLEQPMTVPGRGINYLQRYNTGRVHKCSLSKASNRDLLFLLAAPMDLYSYA